MEPDKNGLKNPEIQDKIKDEESHKKLLEDYLSQDMEALEYFLDTLDHEQRYLKFQEESDEHFSQKEIEETKKMIEDGKEMIKKIHESINEALLNKILVQSKIDELTDLENRFKEILLKINPENLQ